MKGERTCAGCGKDLAGTHGRRKWCSEHCRRRTVYVTPCSSCGTEVYDGSANPPDECGDCKHERIYAERNDLLCAMWEAGEPTWHIAETLGMTESAVTSYVHYRRREGQTLTLRRVGGDSTERESRHRRLIELRKRGFSNAEIARTLGMASAESVSVAFGYLRRKGWEVPSVQAFSADPAELLRLRKQGLTNRAISDRLGYASEGCVANRVAALQRRGYDIPRRRGVVAA